MAARLATPTGRAQFRQRSAPWLTVVAAGAPEGAQLSFGELLSRYSGDEPQGRPVATGPDAPLVLLFTSGTTGTPQGVPVPVRALASFQAYLEFGLDVREDDVFWNAADPGWAYGLYYAILGPLAAGRRSLLLHAGFGPGLTWQVMAAFGVTNFAAAPTVYRSLRAAPDPVPDGVRLRRASSAGEPLTPEVVAWSEQALGVPVRDHYGQTQHGMVVAPAWADAVRTPVPPGSMGRPLPGWSAEVLYEERDVSTIAKIRDRPHAAFVRAVLQEDVQHHAVLVDGPPQARTPHARLHTNKPPSKCQAGESGGAVWTSFLDLPSFVSTRATCFSTVRGDRNRVSAMSWLVAPPASSSATSSSRGDSSLP